MNPEDDVKAKTPWVSVHNIEGEKGVFGEMYTGDEKIVLSTEVVTEVSVEEKQPLAISEKGSRKSVAKRKAKKFAQLVADGKNPYEAAVQLGMNPEKILRNPQIVAALKDLAQYLIPVELQRAAVKSARLKVLIEALEKGDHRMILKAADAIASDPEVGLKTAAPTVQINVRELEGVLKGIDVEPEFLEYERVDDETQEGAGRVQDGPQDEQEQEQE